MSQGAEFVASSSLSVHTLPEGTRLRDYEITGLIGEGGFGIVYLAYDHSLQRRVAIKEYLPAAMASRSSTSAAVVVKSERHRDTFKAGLKSFVNEGRLLARFDHPSLVKVYRFWEENDTAYMVMPFYEGPTLKRALAELGHVPDEAELRTWLRPLLDALAVMHTAHCFHRDIAPDNILLTPTGPLLLDFGAARHVIGDMTHALTVVLKPGFAPIEQYGEVSNMAQGAWTDLYALASVVYAAVTGHPPMSSVERLMDDRMQPLGKLVAGRYSAPFLAAIDAALAVRPADRPPDVAAFRTLLDGRVSQQAPPPGAAPADAAPLEFAAPQDTAPTNVRPTAAPAVRAPAPRRMAPLYATAAALAGLALAGLAYVTARAPAAPPAAATLPAAAPSVAAGPTPSSSSSSSSAPAAATDPGLPMIDAAVAPSTTPAVAAVPPPAAQATSAAPADKPRRETREERPAPAEPADRLRADGPTPTNAAATQSKCSDILQRASLEPLTAVEATFLKRECR